MKVVWDVYDTTVRNKELSVEGLKFSKHANSPIGLGW